MQKEPKASATTNWALALNNHTLALALKFSVIAAVVVVFYLQDLSIVFGNAFSDEATFHILAIPFLFGYLLYRKRKMVAATAQLQASNGQFLQKNFATISGALLCIVAVLVYWFGSYTFTPLEYHVLTLPILAAGLILIFFNGQTLRHLAFPIVFLFFLTPPPAEFLFTIGSTLSSLSAGASNALANAFGIASTLSAQYGSPVITLTRPNSSIMNFSVDVACSGIYSLIGFVIFAAFIAFITKGKLAKKLAILVMGIPLILGLNIIRITTILGIGYSYGDALALQVFHAVGASVLMFIGTLILLGVTEKAFKKPKPAASCPTCKPNTPELAKEFCPNCGKLHNYPKIKLTKIDLAKIAAAIIAVTLLLTIQAPVFALTEGPAQVMIQTPTGQQVNTQMMPLPQIPDYNVSYVYRDTSFEALSGQDASLVYAYGSENASKPTVWAAIELASTIGSLHRWETCLVNYPLSQGNQPSVTQLDLTDIQTQANPHITARFFAFQYHNTNQTQVVLYWYQTATFQVNGTSQQKQIKMSLVTYPQSPEGVKEAENQLLPIATAINGYWQPIQTWTTVALAISQNGLALSAATSAALIALVIYILILRQQDKTGLLRLYSKLPQQTQQLTQAVANTQKQHTTTTNDIATELEKLTDNPTNPAWLNEKLAEAENSGLIKKITANVNDEPTIQWKNQLPNQQSILKRLHMPFF
jgi:exosortase